MPTMVGSGPRYFRGRRGPLYPAAAGAVVGVLILVLLVFPTVFVGGSPLPSKSPAATPQEVDPQFLPAILTSPNSTTDGEFGIAVAVSGSTVASGAPHESVTVYDGPTTYGQVDLLNTATGATGVINGPTVSASQFGDSIAMTPTRIVVGAPGYDNGEGSVYVYNYSTTLLGGEGVIVSTLVATLHSPDPIANGAFGSSVAVSGNLVVVGAPYENATGIAYSGDAYIFDLATGTTVLLTSPSSQISGGFGYGVAISGDRVLIGAPEEVNSSDDVVGDAYVYDASTGNLLTTLNTPQPAFDCLFGRVVAISGTTAVVGEPFGGSGAYYEAGLAFEFNLVSHAVTELSSPAPVTDGQFGNAVAINAGAIVVGAGGETANSNAEAGNTYLFSTATGGLITSDLVAPAWPKGGYFGASVAENGSDGVIVGAPYERADGLADAGHAYFFHQIPLTYSSPNPLLPNIATAASGGLFGQSVAVDNSVTLIGAPGETSGLGSLGAGNAYLLHSSTGPIIPLTPSYILPHDGFGSSVALWGKLAVVGAPDQTAGPGGDGAVYLYNSTNGSLVASLSSPDPSAGGHFGYSVATNGTAVVVGAPGELGGAGTAYIFHPVEHYVGKFEVTTWASIQLNTTHPFRSGGIETGGFGFAVAFNGSTVVVGAPGENSSKGGVPQAGNAYAFDAGNGTLAFNMTSPQPQSQAPGTGGYQFGPDLGFGHSVAVGPGSIVVGSPNQTGGEGAAYVFSETNGSPLHTLTSSNPAPPGYLGFFGWAVADNGGTIAVSAVGESAFGVGGAGNLYLFTSSGGAAFTRYNSPVPTENSVFGESISIGHGGVIVVGQPGEDSSDDYGSGLAYEFFF